MKLLISCFIIFFFCNFAKADFKDIRKKAEIKNPEIIFSIPKKLDRCQTKLYVDPELNIIRPLLKVKAPTIINKQPTEIKSRIKKKTEFIVLLEVITIKAEKIAKIEKK